MRTSLAVTYLLGMLVATTASAATSYLAEGVNATNITASTRFYDNMKGSKAWATTNSHVLDSTLDLYQKDPSLLGDLTNRTTLQNFNPGDYDIYNPTDYTRYNAYLTNSMQNLRDDGLSCWYQVAANVTEYWQSYYGVFADNAENLAYGYNYDRQYLTVLEGAQSLRVGLVMYDNFQNVASYENATPSFEWYLKGTSHNYLRASGTTPQGGTASAGGFFKEYFTGNSASVTVTKTDNAGIVSALESAFSLTKNADGSYTRNTEGQIAYLGITGHALTCYGFELDENGILKTLQIADSDDYLGNKDTIGGTDGYALVTLYVRQGADGKMYLYKDAAFQKAYSSNCYIDSVGYINTPESLKAMYAQYTSAESALIWNGQLGDTWSSDFTTATTEALPTSATGWEVYVDAGGSEHADYYATYYDEGRKVEFGDGGAVPTVNVQGEVKAGGLVLSADSNQYTFTQATDGGSLALSGDIEKIGTATATVHDLAVSAGNLKLQRGELSLTGASTLTLTGSGSEVSAGATLSVSDDSTLVLQGATLKLGATSDTSIGGTVLAAGTGATSTIHVVNTGSVDVSFAHAKIGAGNNLRVYSGNQAAGTVLFDTLELEGDTATLSSVHHAAQIQVNALKAETGSTLNIVNGSDSTITALYRLGSESSVDSGNFTGSINLSSTHPGSKRSASLIIGNETIAQNAVVNLVSAVSADAVLSVGIEAETVRLAGLESSSALGNRAVLYSGGFNAKTQWGEGAIQNGNQPRTLIVNAAADHIFHGKVLGDGMTIEKTGTGTQSFAGDFTTLGGAVVTAGVLNIGNGETMGISIESRGNDGGSICGTISTGDAGANVAIAGAVDSYAEVTDSLIRIKEACTLSLDFVELKGDTVIQAEATGAVVELNNVIAHITLGPGGTVPAAEPVMLMSTAAVTTSDLSANVLEIDFDMLSNVTLKGALIFDLREVENLDSYDYVSVSLAEVSYDSDLMLQAMVNNNIVDTTTLVSGNDNVFYFDTKALAVPEPGTATLSLLALAAFAGRRRRR